MSILIINQLPRRLANYAEWLFDYTGNIIMLTTVKYENEFKGLTKVLTFEDFTNNFNVELSAIELHKKYQFKTIIALDENNIQRAARLREYLNIPGQCIESAEAFRDKVTMKKYAEKAGLNVPKYSAINSGYDLINFINKYNYPVVVKPRDGAGSKNVRILKNELDLNDILQKVNNISGMMVETFISGDMYTIDGLIRNSKIEFISVAKYINNALSHQSGNPFCYTLLSSKHPLYMRLFAFIQQLVQGMPVPVNSSFHCEVFFTHDNQIVFCEIASRTGGANYVDAIEFAYGINLDRYWVRLESGLSVRDIPVSTSPKVLIGGIILQIKPKVLKYIPESIPFDWVSLYYKRGIVGKKYEVADTYIESIGIILVCGCTEEEVANRLNETYSWFLSNVRWE